MAVGANFATGSIPPTANICDSRGHRKSHLFSQKRTRSVSSLQRRKPPPLGSSCAASIFSVISVIRPASTRRHSGQKRLWSAPACAHPVGTFPFPVASLQQIAKIGWGWKFFQSRSSPTPLRHILRRVMNERACYRAKTSIESPTGRGSWRPFPTNGSRPRNWWRRSGRRRNSSPRQCGHECRAQCTTCCRAWKSDRSNRSCGLR